MTETEAIANLLADAAPEVEALDTDQPMLYVRPLPEGWSVGQIDTERHSPAPRRALGTVRVHDADGFIAAINQRVTNSPAVYADEERMSLVAILNDDHEDPGWRDHRVELSLRRTEPWAHWLSIDNTLVEQERFARHIEDGLDELIEPSPAVMLDLAQTFHATTTARFKAGNRLASGVRQFVYEEEQDATAGTDGVLTIPEKLTLSVRPFYGSDLWEVTARFRYDARGGKLTLGYKLNRPGEVERAAFAALRASVADADVLDGVPIIAGVAPAAR